MSILPARVQPEGAHDGAHLQAPRRRESQGTTGRSCERGSAGGRHPGDDDDDFDGDDDDDDDYNDDDDDEGDDDDDYDDDDNDLDDDNDNDTQAMAPAPLIRTLANKQQQVYSGTLSAAVPVIQVMIMVMMIK